MPPSQKPIALILAAGKSSRFAPFNQSPHHKSMVRICGKPILEHTIDSIAEAGLKDIIIVSARTDTEIRDYFQDGKTKKLNIRYVDQPQAKGAGNAILCAAPLLNRPFFVFHTNHVNACRFIKPMLEARGRYFKAVLLGKETKQPWKYGIYKLKRDRIEGIVEKPASAKSPSRYRVVGIYLLEPDFIKILKKTPPAEYQLEEALSRYTREKAVRLVITRKPTFSLKFAWDIFPIMEYLLATLPARISPQTIIHPSALIEGRVHIEVGAQIYERAVIKGPAYIGAAVTVGTGALVRGTACESKVNLGYGLEVKNSLIMEGAHIHSGFIGDSVIGRGARIGAGFITANRRLDRKNITVLIRNKKVATGLNFLGTFVGHEAQIGIRVGTMPGAVIGAKSRLMPNSVVAGHISPGALFPEK